MLMFFFFKQKTAYEMRISDWSSDVCSSDLVIDISGDGRANQGASPDGLRDLAVLQGVTVNGLAILNEDSSVATYYRNNVIGGQGAFVITANDYEYFAQAILEKLIKEIGGVPVVEAPRHGPRPATIGSETGRERVGEYGKMGGVAEQIKKKKIDKQS